MKIRTLVLAALCGQYLIVGPLVSRAHCDSLDGPVVKAAQEALATKDLKRVLIWIQHDDEAEIEKAFKETLAVRKLNPEAMKLADRYFFETVVRVHRAGEGAPFTGLKPAGHIDPVIVAADRTLSEGGVEEFLAFLNKEVARGVRANFKAALEKREFAKDDIEAGRRFVRAYVEYIHFVEAMHRAATTPAPGHSSGDRHEHDEAPK